MLKITRNTRAVTLLEREICKAQEIENTLVVRILYVNNKNLIHQCQKTQFKLVKEITTLLKII